MKKLILTSAAVIVTSTAILFIALSAFAQNSENNSAAQTCQKESLNDKPFSKKWVVDYFTGIKFTRDSWKGRCEIKEIRAREVKDSLIKSKKIPAKKYFMVPMLDSVAMDSTGGC